MKDQTPTKIPMTNAERVVACNARKLAAGGARINTVLPPDTTVQLDALVSEHYAESRLAVIRRAIADAHAATQHRNYIKTT